jgi:hypothetical protein
VHGRRRIHGLRRWCASDGLGHNFPDRLLLPLRTRRQLQWKQGLINRFRERDITGFTFHQKSCDQRTKQSHESDWCVPLFALKDSYTLLQRKCFFFFWARTLTHAFIQADCYY